jgi:lipopolysaccharide/colanic/teichoic acid biosynthesis glycosyltransferase
MPVTTLPAIPAGVRFVATPGGPTGLQGVGKRALDLVVALSLLAVLSPLLVTVALAIKLDSAGPVLLRQQRVGRNLRPFQMLKFRSMVAEAGALQQDLSALNERRGATFKIRNDPRLTRVGRYLRRYSIDELPQLINVVLNDMTLVGPRPPFHGEVEQDSLRQAIRLKFPPGMTGLWQISGRADLEYDEMIRLDLRYTREWSLGRDLSILARTPGAVLTAKGAY